jgi:hypothetical protein
VRLATKSKGSNKPCVIQATIAVTVSGLSRDADHRIEDKLGREARPPTRIAPHHRIAFKGLAFRKLFHYGYELPSG